MAWLLYRSVRWLVKPESGQPWHLAALGSG